MSQITNGEGVIAAARRHGRLLAGGVLTSALLVLASVGAQPSQAAFPGHNGFIAFSSNRDGNFEVYVMAADGSAQTNVTNGPMSDIGPNWSADGTKIAFSSNRDGNFEIYTMNADGSGQTRLTTSAANDGSPKFCPDGRIVFVSSRDNLNGDIFIMNTDGSGQTNLTNDAPVADMPACAPNGLKVAIKRLPFSSEINTMNLDGSDETNLTGASAGDEEYPAWSPDGLQIAVQLLGNVYAMNADGSGLTNLTNTAGPFDGRPAWAPDGTKIAFTSDNDIYTMNADGSAPTKLTGTANNGLPNWQPQESPDPTPTPTPTPTDTTAPDITAFEITRRFSPRRRSTAARRTARRSATIRYSLSEDALVRLVVQMKTKGVRLKLKGKKSCVPANKRNRRAVERQVRRSLKGKNLSPGQLELRARRRIRKAACTLYKAKGKLTHSGSAGKNRLRFSGHFGNRRLGHGRYRMVATATDPAGNVSKKKGRYFTIVRAR